MEDLKVFLFQGDSITDAGRDRDRDDNYGYGYANLFAAEMAFEHPHQFKFYNRGVSGNRIIDMYARIKKDIINLRPAYISFLIGVNDVWHEFSEKNGVGNGKYEAVYCVLIDEIREALPDVEIFILEPFVLPGSGTSVNCDYRLFREEVEKRANTAKEVAEKFNLTFIPLQKHFDELSADGDTSYWLADGVHPTAAGHAVIKRELKKAVTEKLGL